jgi:Tol biopolymer transport system component
MERAGIVPADVPALTNRNAKEIGMRRILITAIAALGAVAVTVPAAATPGGERILFQSLAPGGGDTLYTMAVDGSDVERLPLKVPGSAISPDWSPDGTRVAFAMQIGDSQSIWTAAADGSNARELFHCGGTCLGADYPAWSPDGQQIAFTYANAKPAPKAGPPSGDSIRVIDLRSRKVRVVVRSTFPTLVDLARWSPEGKQLVVERDRFSSDGTETGCRIEIVRINDGHVRPLTPFASFGFHPDWSSHGNLITFDSYDLLAFGDRAPGSSNLFVVRPDGTHLHQLTHFRPGGNRVSAATFTPDASRILFTYQVGRNRKAGSIPSSGGAITTIPSQYGGPVTHPRLSPQP